MNWKYLLVGCVLVLLGSTIAILVRALLRAARDAHRWPFVQQRPLSRPEQVLYFRLVDALPGHVVLAQVQLSRFLRARKGRNPREWLNKVERKSVDYLVCTRDFAIVAAIELDDGSHDRPYRAVSDADRDRALEAADVPLIRWHVSALPNTHAIRAMLDSVVQDRSGEPLAQPARHDRHDRHDAVLRPGHGAPRIDASNDPKIFDEETRT